MDSHDRAVHTVPPPDRFRHPLQRNLLTSTYRRVWHGLFIAAAYLLLPDRDVTNRYPVPSGVRFTARVGFCGRAVPHRINARHYLPSVLLLVNAFRTFRGVTVVPFAYFRFSA